MAFMIMKILQTSRKLSEIIFLFIILLICMTSLSFADESMDPSWVYTGRGDRYLHEEQVGPAITQYKKAIIAKRLEAGTGGTGAFPEIHYRLAKIYMDEGLNNVALQHINRAENEREFLQIPDFIYNILYLKADIFYNMKRYTDMIEVYHRIIKDDVNWDFYSKEKLTRIPDTMILEMHDPELRIKYSEAYYRLGEMKYLNNNYVTAEPYLKMAFLYGYGQNEKKYLITCYQKLGMKAQIEKLNSLK